MNQELRKKHLFEMTGHEFIELFKYSLGLIVHDDEAAETSSQKTTVEKHYLHGLKELGNFLGCSAQNASIIKNSGIIDGAVAQVGRHIIIDHDLCFELLKIKKNVHRKKQKTIVIDKKI